MNDTFDMPKMLSEIARDEGIKLIVYNDTMGVPTIGCGRNLRDVGITQSECDLLTSNSIAICVADLDTHETWWRDLDRVRQRVMINMCYNLGYYRLSQFHNFLNAMHENKWGDAAREMEASEWWSQVGDRAKRLQMAVITGKMP